MNVFGQRKDWVGQVQRIKKKWVLRQASTLTYFSTCPFEQLTKKSTCPTQSFSCPKKLIKKKMKLDL
jgi:hypothetical protein